MEGDVALIADRPAATSADQSSDNVKKEQEKWDAWKAHEGISRTEAKRRYIEKLIETMHKYASNTSEARELVEELEFVWDQVKNNSQHPSSGSEHSSPLQQVERSGYLQNGSSSGPGIPSSVAALEGGPVNVDEGRDDRQGSMRVLSPVSQADEELMDEERDEEEFVDAPVSQADEADLQDLSEGAEDGGVADAGVQATIQPRVLLPSRADTRWRRRIESSLIKMTNEVAALREQLESSRYLRSRSRKSLFGWVLRLSWWAVQLVVTDAVLLWIVILYLRRKDDRRLEGAVRVLLGDAVAQMQQMQKQMPTLPKIGGRKQN